MNSISIYKYNGLKIMLVTTEHCIDEVLEGFENVLRGQGYQIDGRLDIVKDE